MVLNSEIRMIPILSSVWGEHFYTQAGTGEQKALCFMTHLRRGRLRKASDYSVFSLFLKFLKIFHFSRFSVSAYYIQNPSETRVGKLITEHPAANLRLWDIYKVLTSIFLDFVLTLYVISTKIEICFYFVFPLRIIFKYILSYVLGNNDQS